MVSSSYTAQSFVEHKVTAAIQHLKHYSNVFNFMNYLFVMVTLLWTHGKRFAALFVIAQPRI
jgi:hypothetical protein